mgnify:CR=1 FL=1
MNLLEVKLIDIPTHQDERGILSSIEQSVDIPFEIKRVFYVYHIKGNRGYHAPIDTDEVLIPVSGSFHIRLFDKNSSREYFLNDPAKGLYIPRMIYLEMFNFSEDAVCMVLANTSYDSDKYLRSLDEYLAYVNKS